MHSQITGMRRMPDISAHASSVVRAVIINVSDAGRCKKEEWNGRRMEKDDLRLLYDMLRT